MFTIQKTVLLSGFLGGLAFGAATIFSWIAGFEHIVAILIFVGLAKIAIWFGGDAPKRNAFAAGFVAAVTLALTQGLFLETYFANNPAYRDTEIPFGLSPRLYIASFAPVFGIAAGLFTALIAWALAPLFRLFR